MASQSLETTKTGSAGEPSCPLLSIAPEIRRKILQELLCSPTSLSYACRLLKQSSVIAYMSKLRGSRIIESKIVESLYEDVDYVKGVPMYAWKNSLGLYPQILSTCKQLKHEGRELLYNHNTWQLYTDTSLGKILYPRPDHDLFRNNFLDSRPFRTRIPRSEPSDPQEPGILAQPRANIPKAVQMRMSRVTLSIAVKPKDGAGDTQARSRDWKGKYSKIPSKQLREAVKGKDLTIDLMSFSVRKHTSDDVDEETQMEIDEMMDFLLPLRAIRCKSCKIFINGIHLVKPPKWTEIMLSTNPALDLEALFERYLGWKYTFYLILGDVKCKWPEELERRLMKTIDCWDEEGFSRVREELFEALDRNIKKECEREARTADFGEDVED